MKNWQKRQWFDVSRLSKDLLHELQKVVLQSNDFTCLCMTHFFINRLKHSFHLTLYLYSYQTNKYPCGLENWCKNSNLKCTPCPSAVL